MRRWLLAAAALAAVSLSACNDATLATASAPNAPSLSGGGESGDPCERIDGEYPEGCPEPQMTSTWPFFGPPNDILYEAPGDPSPGQPGIWLGASVTPSGCFRNLNPGIADSDNDWLADHCELELARGFAPTMKMSIRDGCPDGEPYWAAKYFTTGHVRLAFLPAYYDDCGAGSIGGGHAGDSEFIMVEVVFDPATQHWKFNQMWLSAHHEATFWGISGDRSAWVAPSEAQFTRRALAHPTAWVAIRKHANYKSSETCNKTFFGDECEWSPLDPLRFPILAHRNIGSRWVDLVGCPASEKDFAGNGRTECFYQERNFRGWKTDHYGGNPAPYRYILVSDKFENRFGDVGPGPLPPA